MTPLETEFRRLMAANLDISEHLGFLRGLACDPMVNSIVEIGFRNGVSATALATAGKSLTCVDVERCMPGRQKLAAIGGKFSFIHGNSLEIEIPECDLLHIDGLHTYKQLSAELKLHSPRVRKWIVMHDTTTFGEVSKDGSKPGLLAAINEFVDLLECMKRETEERWKPILSLTNCNGLTLLERFR
jgi:hypothetical protein